jgi:epoxyqueuosine reductase
MDNRKDQIKIIARQLGFEKIGFSPAEPILSEIGRLTAWLDKNYHGDLSWLAKTESLRLDPLKFLPGTKTIISLAANYYNKAEYPREIKRGKVSRYAWGDDYHSVITDRLEKLLSFVKSLIPSAQAKTCVDNDPVLEKYWAERSGIGWRGKHTIIITEDLGSWIFLGEILLNENFEYDLPQPDQCGSCTLCMDACPTQAIVEPYILDVKKCISYLTVEYKGEYSADMIKERGGWLYGCDICQEVCPWNQGHSRQTKIEEFFMREDIIAPHLDSVISMTEKEFVELFKNNPLEHIRLNRIKRNARILMENNLEHQGM